MTQTGTRKTTRAERLAMPLAREVVRDLAVEHGACIRPVQLRRTDLGTGAVEQILVPCGHTLAAVCPACAERARTLRAAQCREGWHLDDRTGHRPGQRPPRTSSGGSRKRAEAQAMRDQAADGGQDTGDLDELTAELDDEITDAGMRGNVLPARPVRRHRTTRRRQDAAPLPRRKIAPQTIGKTYTTPDGKQFRPSLFITLTCPSYGRVSDDGTPADPDGYDYVRAARDALHFAALFDRFIQNLRRFLGYDLQYFAAIEPQRRLAPHIHLAMRGTVSRADLRRVLAATYHQVWWPDTSIVRFDGQELPVWDEQTGTYLDPTTGEVLPTWDDALDAIGPDDEPLHVARFGDRFDAQGVLAGSKDAARCIGYLTKYLTKQVADCHQATSDTQRAHMDTAGGGAAVRAVLAAVRQLAPLRHPAQKRPARPDPRRVQRQSPPPRIPRLPRPPGARLPQMVRQDARRPPGRPQELAPDHPRPDRHRPSPLRLGTRRTRRPRLHGTRPAPPARRRRPPALARRPRRSKTPGRPPARPRSFGNREGGMTSEPAKVRPGDPLAGLPLLIAVPEAAKLLGISRAAAYRFARAGDLPTKRLGRRVYVMTAQLREFIETESEAA